MYRQLQLQRLLPAASALVFAACSQPQQSETPNTANPTLDGSSNNTPAVHQPASKEHGSRQNQSFATPLSKLPRPPHEMVVELLLADHSAVPARPKIHPIRTVFNREAIVPPMCYTRTEGQHNPCYVCHQNELPGRVNTMNDGDLQEAYSFSDVGLTNRWYNLFKDRSAEVAKISDEEILGWVAQDNYSDLSGRLREDGFSGYIPDLKNLHLGADAFDAEGFAKDGSGWVAFNYKPLPSTFWPTNGATDDVMIRLWTPFRQDAQGNDSRDVYKANLALVEANLKDLDTISVSALDERKVGKDLNLDGRLSVIDKITDVSTYVGAALEHYKQKFLLPINTEFLHSVRYLGIDADGGIKISTRMKELRYMHKRFMLTPEQHYEAYLQEGYAKDDGQLPGYIDRGQHGLDNGMGWVIGGFIENSRGELRFNTYEENTFCMGCHTSVGATIDNTFSFARKIDGAEGWGYINLKGMPDAPNMGETQGEILTYLQRAGGGGEFRSNPEMEQRWFKDGKVDAERVANAKDVYELITPSRQRALALNKAYKVIVASQEFYLGRDPTVTPPVNVYDKVDNQKSPTLPADRIFKWDIRLDWQNAN